MARYSLARAITRKAKPKRLSVKTGRVVPKLRKPRRTSSIRTKKY